MRKLIIIIILEKLLKLLWVLPLNKKKILFFSYGGKQYSDSPKYLSEYIKNEYPEYELYWAFDTLQKFSSLSNKEYKLLKYKSWKFIFHFITSKVIITNDSVRPFLPVRRSQIFLNTWHGGSPLKTCGLAESSVSKELKRELRLNEKKVTAYLSSSKFMTEEVFQKSFNYHGTILEFGMPRNAIFYTDYKEVRKKVYDYFRIDYQQSLVLYAPTFREDSINNNFLPDSMQLDVSNCLSSLEMRFQNKFCFLFRAHHAMRKIEENERIKSATYYPDMQELLCAADILITDYSSCMGDMALMYKPVFLYTPDLKDYIKNRGFYWDIHSLPFPLAETDAKFNENIMNFDFQSYEKGVKQYFEKLGSVESGDSIRNTCSWIFSQLN